MFTVKTCSVINIKITLLLRCCQLPEITSIAQHFNMFHWKTRVDQEVIRKDEFVYNIIVFINNYDVNKYIHKVSLGSKSVTS